MLIDMITVSLFIASPIVTRVSNEVEIGVKGNNISLTFGISRDVPQVAPDSGISWYLMRNNGSVEMIDAGPRHEFDVTRTSLTITDLNLDDEGTYSLNASNIIGIDSDTVFLDVQSESFLSSLIPSIVPFIPPLPFPFPSLSCIVFQ